MNKTEIKTASALLADHTQRTETVAVDGGGWAITAYWLDGGQKMFYSLDAVRDYLQYTGNASTAAAALGRIKSPAKAKAARENGKKGGRPAIDIEPMLALIEEEGDLCRADYYRRQYPAEWRKARRLDRINTWRDDTGTEYVEVGPQQ